MSSLIQNLWIPDSRRTTLYIDSYRDGVFQGWISGMGQNALPFYSLSQLLVLMEELLEENQAPQSYTSHRSFFSALPRNCGCESVGRRTRGNLATFELKILFRQHSSWQGTVFWQEEKQEKSFRSVLELILLLDSALRQQEGKEAV